MKIKCNEKKLWYYSNYQTLIIYNGSFRWSSTCIATITWTSTTEAVAEVRTKPLVFKSSHFLYFYYGKIYFDSHRSSNCINWCNFTQLSSTFYFSILVLAARYIYYNSWSRVSGKNSQYKRLPHRENSTQEKIVDLKEPSSANILWCLTKLGIVLAYFYISDRTNFLLKENK